MSHLREDLERILTWIEMSIYAWNIGMLLGLTLLGWVLLQKTKG